MDVCLVPQLTMKGTPERIFAQFNEFLIIADSFNFTR